MEIDIYTDKQIKKYDPTHTTVLRNAFSRTMKKKFSELCAVIRKGVGVNDCFGLVPKVHTLQSIPSPDQFAFARSDEKVAAFMRWLDIQVKAGFLSTAELEQIGKGVNNAWTNLYIWDSYKRGVIRARYELIQAGYNVPPLDETGGIAASMGMPMHVDRLGLLFTRVYSDLKGITDTMAAQIARILAQGIADGDSPRLLARKLVATIDGTGIGSLGITDTLGRFIPAARRAEMLARTEIIRAHHLATIQEYRNWSVLNIIVQGEWKTAGDERVCPKCEQLDGQIFTLDEIENMIPAHPMCRCIALPYIVK